MGATPYDLLGDEGIRRLAERFYVVVEEDPKAFSIRNMHESDLEPIKDKLYHFLRAWMGGPRDYFERPDAPCIMSVHKKLPIGAAERDQWLACMNRALGDIGAPAELTEILVPAFERMADAMRSL